MNGVNIIGAGLGGLTLAHALRKAGTNVWIYERGADIDARRQGYRIGFQDYGLSALCEYLPRTAGELRSPALLVDHNLNLVSSFFRDIPLLGLADRIHFGKRLTGFTDEPSAAVRAHFADGTSADADLPVGAEGGNSTVRRGLLPHNGLTEFGITGAMGQIWLTARWWKLSPGTVTTVRGLGLDLRIGRTEFPRRLAEILTGVRLTRTGDLPESASRNAVQAPSKDRRRGCPKGVGKSPWHTGTSRRGLPARIRAGALTARTGSARRHVRSPRKWVRRSTADVVAVRARGCRCGDQAVRIPGGGGSRRHE